MRKLVFYYYSYLFYALLLFLITRVVSMNNGYIVNITSGIQGYISEFIFLGGVTAVSGSGRKHIKKNDIICLPALVLGSILQLAFLIKMVLYSNSNGLTYALAIAWIVPTVISVGKFFNDTPQSEVERNRDLTKRMTKYFAICGGVLTLGFMSTLFFLVLPKTNSIKEELVNATSSEFATIISKVEPVIIKFFVIPMVVLFIFVELLFYLFFKKEVDR